MRVLHVSEVATGGVAALLRSFTGAQAAQGDEPYLLCPSPVGTDPGRHEQWQVHRKRPSTFPGAIRQLRQQVRLIEPDVVHLHSFFAGFLGRVPSGFLSPRVAVVYQPHSWNHAAAPNRAAHAALNTWERLAARRTDAIVVNCDDEAREAGDHGIRPEPMVVGLPVDVGRFVPASQAQRAATSDRLGLAGRRVVVCIGALCWQKGQDRLVTAWERDPVPNAVLVLVGGSHGPYLRRQGAEALRVAAPTEWGRSILATGHQDDVRPWLHAADVTVLASRYEGMAVAVAESLCAGVPVVMFDVNGAREAIEDGPEGPAGAVVRQNDTDALLREVRRRLDTPALLSRESEKARRRGVRLFAPEHVMNRLSRAYATASEVAGSDAHS